MRTIHLFGGFGGGLLADRILGHEPVAVVEWNPERCAVLRERAAQGWFPGLVVHQCDVRDFDPSPYAGRVDCVSAGFPCQDVSRIGSGAGLDGARSGLYAEALRCIRVVRSRFAFLENVADLVSGGLYRVTGDLAEMGYDARWCCLSSGNTGASFDGDRWWCLAEAVRDGLEGILRGGGSAAGSSPKAWPRPTKQDSVGSRRIGYVKGSMHSGTTMTDACAIHLGETIGPAGNGPRIMVLPNPDFVEWLMRWPGGWSRLDSPESETDKIRSAPPRRGACSEGREP